MSIAYSVTKDGLITDHRDHPGRWGAFNEAIQAFLLPRLSEINLTIDPYDGGEFSSSQLECVEKAVRAVSQSISELPENLGLVKEMMDFYNSCNLELPLSPKESALKTLSQLNSFCQKAKLENETLVFVGD